MSPLRLFIHRVRTRVIRVAKRTPPSVVARVLGLLIGVGLGQAVAVLAQSVS